MQGGKTIQIFLPDGNPRGVRIAEFTNRTVQAVSFPRSLLELASKREELGNVGVYFLIGAEPDQAKQSVYVGEAENCLTRLKQHNQTKDFWASAIAIISKTKQFTKGDIKYLEWYCLNEVDKARRYNAENTTKPSRPHISESTEADLLDNFESVRILVATLGHPLFDRVQGARKEDQLVCKGKAALAHGEFTEDGLVVLSGSTSNIEETKAAGSWVRNRRQSLIDEEILVLDGDVYKFTSDHIFPSPSAAAAAVLGRRANGWTEWKYADGRTLDEVKRGGGTEDQ